MLVPSHHGPNHSATAHHPTLNGGETQDFRNERSMRLPNNLHTKDTTYMKNEGKGLDAQHESAQLLE